MVALLSEYRANCPDKVLLFAGGADSAPPKILAMRFDDYFSAASPRAVFALMLALAQAGCGGRPYERPPAPIADAWPATGYKVGSQSPRELDWRDFFQDPRLRAMIALGLEHNRDLALAMNRIEEARAAYGLASAEKLPNVALTGSAPQSAQSKSIAGGVEKTNFQSFDLKMSLVSYELDFWGRISGMSDAARARLAGTEAASRAVRLTVIAEIANAYYSRLDLTARTGLLGEVIAAREQTRNLMQQAFEQGAVSKLEILQAEAVLETSRGELSAMQTQLNTTSNYLTFLTGHKADDLPPGYSLAAQRLDAAFSYDLPSEILLKRPDVMASEQRLIEARANVDAARAAFFTRILLTAGFGLASLSLGKLFSADGRGAWNFIPNFTMPLFDGGRASGSVDLATARENIAVADYERTIQIAFREVADLLAAQAGVARQRRAVESAWVVQQQRAIATEARFRGGSASYIEVLDVMREELAAAQQLSSMRRAELTNATLLYKALGGGLDVVER